MLYSTCIYTNFRSFVAVTINKRIIIFLYAQVLKKFVRDFQKELCKDLKEESGDY